MRTVVDIDDDTLARAMTLTGLRKKVDVVNLALRELVVQLEREQILDLAGTIAWLSPGKEDRRDPDR